MRNDAFQFFPILIFSVAISLLGFIWHQSTSMEDIYLQRVQNELLIRSHLLEPEVRKLLERPDVNAIDEFGNRIDKLIDTRITLIAADGKVLFDSQESAEKMGNHLKRPEIATAFGEKIPGSSVRYSATLSTRMVYTAIPIEVDGKAYVLRTAVSLKSIDDVIRQARRDIIIVGLLVALVTSGLSYSIVRGISKPIESLKFNAARIAAGNLDIKLPIPEKGAIRELALSLSNMAEQLKYRIDEITREKNERDAIFSSMTEGVIALGLDGNILDINNAALIMFDLPENAVGLSFYGVVRNRPLQDFVEQIFREKKTLETEVTIFNVQERSIRARGTVLKMNQNQIFGTLIVLSDFTQIRKLENFRRDFIADVSHEIKTPLTVIRGAVETLQEGAINEPENAEKFMNIITKHTDRLNALVKDILSLSGLEQKTRASERDFTVLKLSGPVGTAIELCKERAEGRKIELNFEKDDNLKVQGDCQLLEQAVVNLIENAIKYSGDDSVITASINTDGNDILIKVADNGCGIASEHLPRLFERFYRVDKARSRKLGGTGLGLSIVKHIAQLHRGSVSVASTLGRGSIFTIRLPRYQG
ncbi:MAG: ATP-binding protein [Victivallaceae bacterium]